MNGLQRFAPKKVFNLLTKAVQSSRKTKLEQQHSEQRYKVRQSDFTPLPTHATSRRQSEILKDLLRRAQAGAVGS